MKIFRSRVFIVFAVFIILILGWLIISNLSDVIGNSYAPVLAYKGSDKLEERGWIVANETYPVRLGASGTILTLYEDGAPVKEGDLLIELDPTDARSQLDTNNATKLDMQRTLMEAQSEFEEQAISERRAILDIDAKLQRVEVELKRLQETLSPEEKRLREIEIELARLTRFDAEEALVRQRRLFDAGMSSPIQFEEIRRNADVAKLREEELILALDLVMRGPDPSALEELQRERSRLLDQKSRSSKIYADKMAMLQQEIEIQERWIARQDVIYKHFEVEMAAANVYAQADGVFVRRQYMDRSSGSREWTPLEAGLQKWHYDTIGDIIDPSRLSLEVYVNEADVSGIEVGDQVDIRLPALPNVEVTGRIYSRGGLAQDRFDAMPIGMVAEPTGVHVVPLQIELDDQHEGLRPGMSAYIYFQNNQEEGLLLVPAAAIQEGRVTVRSDDKLQRSEVIEFVRSLDDYALVRGDLRVGEEVFIYD